MRNRKCVQLNALVCLFVVTIIFSLGMSSVADAAFGSAQQLSGTYIRSDQQASEIPTDFFEFSNDSFIAPTHRNSVGSKGKYSITGDMIEFVHSDGKIEAFKLSRTQNTIMLNNGSRSITYVLATSERLAQIKAAKERQKAQQIRLAEEKRAREAEEALAHEATKARKAEEARKAKEARDAEEARKLENLKAAGFIAFSEYSMNWAKAKTFCQRKGGRLPLIDGSDLPLGSVPEGTPIEGFRARGARWPSGLPRGYYWTGTERTRGNYSFIAWDNNDNVGIASTQKSYDYIYTGQTHKVSVVCVPHDGVPEDVRKIAEETASREAAEVAKAAGFLAMADLPMTWAEAKTYCQRQGGRLPFIGGSKLYSKAGRMTVEIGTPIEGFGNLGEPWSTKLPYGNKYWTGTANGSHTPFAVYGVDRIVGYSSGSIQVLNYSQDSSFYVACVSLPADDNAMPASAVSEAAAPTSETTNPAHTASTPAQPSYPPLTATDGKPKVAVHLVRLENGVVELDLQMIAPGKKLEAVRIDNLGGVSSHWRSDGKDKTAPLAVSKGGTKLSSGAQVMDLALGNTEALFSLSLKDNGAFAGKNTEFRVTVFFVGGERTMCALGAKE